MKLETIYSLKWVLSAICVRYHHCIFAWVNTVWLPNRSRHTRCRCQGNWFGRNRRNECLPTRGKNGGRGDAGRARRALKGTTAIVVAKTILGLPIFIARATGGAPLQSIDWWIAAAAIAAILGHVYPVWLRFHGGKGVATGVGVFLMLTPMAVAMAALVFIVVVTSTRYVSLGSILAAITIPLLVLLQHEFLQPVAPLAPIISAAAAGAALIVFAHRENIGRLLGGNESKFK